MGGGAGSGRYGNRQIFINIQSMQKVIQKSLRATLLQEISKLNITNAEFYALLRKLNTTQHPINQTFHQKLQSMRTDIRNKVKALASNVDLMYQMFDRKIALLISKIGDAYTPAPQLDQQLRQARLRNQELSNQVTDLRNKYTAVLTQNQFLKNKNIALLEELEALSKRKTHTITNDSSRNINQKTDTNQDGENSIQNYGSPLQQPQRPTHQGNDLTFNKNYPIANNKKIKSEQNSFSSLLIKEQNSFEPSYGSDRKESSKFGFGCMPVRNNDQMGDVKFQLNRKKPTRQTDGDQDQSHRMSFLINNLKQTEQESFSSSSSSRYHFSREDSHNKSVLSRGVVKKYHI